MSLKSARRDPLEVLMDHRRIELVLAVAQAGSYSRAALNLGISQPAVSQQIRLVEAALGVKLFRRGRHGIHLTQDGSAVLVYARAMHRLTNNLRRELSEGTARLKVGVGISEDLCRTALPTVLRRFYMENPGIDFRILSGTYDNIAAGLASGVLDFAVTRRYSRFHQTETLWTDDLVWLGVGDWKFTPAEHIPLALPLAPNPAREPPVDALRKAGREWNVTFESSGLAGVEAAMQAGIGICAGPRHMRVYDGVKPLPVECGLPSLPRAEFAMTALPLGANAAVHAAAEVFRQASKLNFGYNEPC